MSAGDVEIAKRAIDAFARRDLDSYDDLFTSDAEWLPAGPLALQGEGYTGYLGREGLETYFRDSRDMWEKIRPVAEEYRDLGDRVLMLGRLHVIVKSSGVALDSPNGVVFDFCDGKISRMRAYLDHVEALRAAGRAG
jgi:ketosteroid isomerase-like protein